MIKTKIYKINSDYINEYKKWGILLMGDLLEQAKQSLNEEGCILETLRLFSINDTYFVVGIMIGAQGISDFKKPQNTEINVIHKIQNKKLFLEEISLEELYTIETY